MRTTAALIGASGHLGQELVRQLAAAGVEVRTGGPDVQGADVVVNIDERVALPEGGDPLGPVDSSGVDALLRAVAAGRVGRLVHVSSGAALVPGLRPTGDELVRRAGAAGYDVVAVHPTAIIGPGDPGVGRLARFLRDLWEHRRPAPVGGGFDWVDVRDVAAGTVAAATTAPPGRDYLLAGHWATVEDVAGRALLIAAEATGGERRPAVGPEPLGAAAIAEPDGVAVARDELGFRARPLDETLRDTFDWFAARDLVRDALALTDGSLVPA